MITKDDISYFYDEYFKNINKEREIEDEFRETWFQRRWITNLKERSTKLHEIYDRNEELLNKYLRPFFWGTEHLTDEVAREMLHQINIYFYEEYFEYLVMLDVLLLLLDYFYKTDDGERTVICAGHLSLTFNEINYAKYQKKSIECSDKVLHYRNKPEVFINHQNLLYFFTVLYDKGIVYGNNPDASVEDCINLLKSLDGITEDPGLLAKADELGLDRTYITETKRMLTSRTFVAKIINTYERKHNDKIYKAAYELFETNTTCKTLSEEESNYINLEYYFTHHKFLWLMEKITTDDCLKAYKEYYDEHLKKALHDAKESDTVFQEAIGLMLFFYPEMLKIRDNKGDDTISPESEKFLANLLPEYVKFVERIPKTHKDTYLCANIYESTKYILPYISNKYDAFDILFKVMVERDIDVINHSSMVAIIAEMILDKVHEATPLMLIGCMDIRSEKELDDRYDELKDYVIKAAKIHDIGKIAECYVTTKQTRRISGAEYEDIKMHVNLGAQLAEASPQLKKYIPMIMGHHKAYDDMGGYPSDYKYKQHENAILVNILQIADSIDAATDTLGRIYKKAKTSDEILAELSLEAGTRYNPEIVSLIVKDTSLCEQISHIISDTREEVCRTNFDKFFRKYKFKSQD